MPVTCTIAEFMEFRHRVSWYAIYIKAFPSTPVHFATPLGVILSESDP